MPPGDLICLSSEDEFTLPATISCDATVIEDEDAKVIPWFRFTSKKKRRKKNKDMCDALTWFAVPDRNDFTFRFLG